MTTGDKKVIKFHAARWYSCSCKFAYFGKFVLCVGGGDAEPEKSLTLVLMIKIGQK
jgi:hypothetical protein